MTRFNFRPQKGVALLMVMAIIAIVLTTISIGVTLLLNNLDAVRGKDDSSQALEAAQAGIEQTRGFFKENESFFSGCAVNDCLDFTNDSCTNCNNSSAIYTDINNRYTYQVMITAMHPDGLTVQSTGFKGLFKRFTTAGLIYKPPFQCGMKIKDAEGSEYRTVSLGTQCWMAENLRIRSYPNGTCINNISLSVPNCPAATGSDNTKGRSCYSNSESNCNQYGSLYQWAAVMNNSTTPGVQGICPTGWHVPSEPDWHVLEAFYTDLAGGEDCDDNRSGKGCIPAGEELQVGGSSNFDILLSGLRDENGKNFSGLTSLGVQWTSTQHSAQHGQVRRFVSSDESVYRDFYKKEFALSVRCLKD